MVMMTMRTLWSWSILFFATLALCSCASANEPVSSRLSHPSSSSSWSPLSWDVILVAQELLKRDKLSWPSQREALPTSKKLSSTFAESRSTRYHLGVDIVGNDVEVFPMHDNARVLYYRVSGDNPYLAMPGSGNTLFLEYPGDVVSGYFHLAADSFYAQTLHSQGFPEKIDQNRVVAKTGNTGRSYGAHLHFFIYNKKTNILMNPQKALSTLTDTTPPRIASLVKMIPDPKAKGQDHGMTMVYINNASQTNIEVNLNREESLYVQIVDQGERKFSRLGIYSYRWSLNQRQDNEVVFNECRILDGMWTCGSKSFAQVYYKNLYKLPDLEFIEGVNVLEIGAVDFAGNESVSQFILKVSLSTASL